MVNNRLLVIGANGRVGREIVHLANSNDLVSTVGFNALDITKPNDIHLMLRALKPTCVINCAAISNVDVCELDTNYNFMEVNAYGPARIAQACTTVGSKFIHLSSDYVYDCEDSKNPCTVDSPLHTVKTSCNQYATSKIIAELLLTALQTTTPISIVRTAWVFGNNKQDFVTAIVYKLIKLIIIYGTYNTTDKKITFETCIPDNMKLQVTDEEVGSPTYTMDLAEKLLMLAKCDIIPKCINLANSGVCSRYDMAQAIASIMGIPVTWIAKSTTYARERPANRPPYSAIDLTETQVFFNSKPRSWQRALEECLYTRGFVGQEFFKTHVHPKC